VEAGHNDALPALRVTVLGPVRAWLGGYEPTLGGPRQRIVLTVLAMRANRTVTRDEIIDAVWADDPPASVVNIVHVHINALRRAFEPHRQRRQAGRLLTGTGSGYLLHLAPGHLDADVFREHMQRASRLTADDQREAAVAEYDAALTLWHGTPLANLPGHWAETQRHELTELHLAALEDRADTLLQLGRHGEVIPSLATLVAEQPLRERPCRLLMLALYRAGRRADALNVYTETRRLFVDELGVEPGQTLQQIHKDILTNTDPIDRRSTPSAVGRQPGRSAVPRQLPHRYAASLDGPANCGR
jgi:DNA-binding SARP family transcriptional activator